MSYKKILCFGSLNPDLIYFVDELPKRGDDIRSSNSIEYLSSIRESYELMFSKLFQLSFW